MFISLGSEFHLEDDISYWTSGSYDEYMATGGVTVDNGRYIVFESTRPRPVGGATSGEKQLIAADTHTGGLYWLRAITGESPSTYGDAHINLPTEFHYDCCESANLIVFRDITGHRLYCLNLNTGAVNQLLHLAGGTFFGAPTIAANGNWVIINALMKGPDEGSYLAGTTSVVLKIMINPATGQATSSPTVVFDKTSLVKGSFINAYLGIAVNKFSGDVVIKNTIADEDYSETALNAIRFVQGDGALSYDCMQLASGQTASNLFWAGSSRYVYYIDGNNRLSRLHTLTRRHQRWTQTLAARQMRLKPAKSKETAISAVSGFGINTFNMSSDEKFALYSVEGSGLYLVNIQSGKTKQLLSLPNSIQSAVFDLSNDKAIFKIFDGANSKIGTVFID